MSHNYDTDFLILLAKITEGRESPDVYKKEALNLFDDMELSVSSYHFDKQDAIQKQIARYKDRLKEAGLVLPSTGEQLISNMKSDTDALRQASIVASNTREQAIATNIALHNQGKKMDSFKVKLTNADENLDKSKEKTQDMIWRNSYCLIM